MCVCVFPKKLLCPAVSLSMLQVLEESNSLTLSINQGTLLSQGVVLKRRRFQHAILSGSRSVRRWAVRFSLVRLVSNESGTSDFSLASHLQDGRQ